MATDRPDLRTSTERAVDSTAPRRTVERVDDLERQADDIRAMLREIRVLLAERGVHVPAVAS